MKFSIKNWFFVAALTSIIIINLSFAFYFWDPGDLDSFLSSGFAVARGLNPYTAYAIHYSSPEYPALNFNPPLSLLFFAPLSKIDLYTLHPYWIVVSLFCFFISIILLIQKYKPKYYMIMWVFAFSALGDILALGQIYIFLLLLITLAWILLDEHHDIMAGILIGILIAIKPNFAIWPLFLFIIQCRKVSIISFISAIFYSLLPIIIWGPKVYFEWLPIALGQVKDALNVSLIGVAIHFHLTWLKIPLMIVIIGSAAIWSYFKKPNLHNLSGVALLVSLIASPLAWPTYTIILIPIFLSRPWSNNLFIAAAVFLIPAGLLNHLQYSFPSISNYLGLPYTFGLVILLIDCILYPKHIIYFQHERFSFTNKSNGDSQSVLLQELNIRPLGSRFKSSARSF